MADNNPKVVISAEDKTGPAIASAVAGFKSMGKSIDELKAFTIGGVSAAGLVLAVKSIIDLGDEMNDLSQKVGISIRDLSAWQLAANQSGTSIESVAKGVKGLSQYMLENGDALKKAGIDAIDANGALMQLADMFAALPDGMQKNALATKLFGKAGMELIPMLNLGSKGLAEAAEKSAAYGKKMEALAPLADKFNDQMAELGLHSKETAMSIATYFLPGLSGMVQLLNDLKSGGDRAKSALEWLDEKVPLGFYLRWTQIRDVAALAGVGSDASKRTSSGKIGVKGLSAAEELALGDKNEQVVDAMRKAQELLGKERNAKEAAYLSGLHQQLVVATGDISEYSKQLTYLNEGAGKEFSAATRAQALALAKQIDTLRENKKMLEQREQVLRKVASAEDRAGKTVRDFGEKQDQGVEDVRSRTSALGKTPQEVKQIEAARAIEKAYEDAVRKVNDELGQIGDIEGISEKVGELQRQRDKAHQDMAKALADEKAAQDALNASWEYGADEALRKYGEQVQNVAATVENSMVSAFRAAEDALVNFVMKGKLDFASLTESILSGLVRIQIQRSIMDPLVGTKDNPGILSQGLNALFGGIAGARASGGPVSASSAYLVGERGPEIFMPSTGGTIVPNSAIGGGTSVTVNLIEDNSRAGQVQQRQSGGQSMLDVFVAQIRSVVAGDISTGRGPIPASLESTYGANRAVGAY